MRAITYDRVSEDRRDGRSVAEQNAENEAECARRGWTIVARYTDNDRGASRYSRKTRPAWEQVKAAIAARQGDVLVTWEASRAQRDLAAYTELRDLCRAHGVLWCYSGRLYDLSRSDDRFSTGLDALLAEREVDVTRDRVLRAVRAQAAAGRPHGRILYGYTRRYDPTSGALLEQIPDPGTAPVVQDIFRRYLAGESLRGIATRLGPPWRPDQIARILDNPGYAARRVYRGQVIGRAAWPALVDDITWLAVRRRRDTERTPHYGRAVVHLLSGILRCGECGHGLSTQKNRDHRAYLCRNGFHVSIATRRAEDYLVSLLLARLASPAALDALGRGPASGEQAEHSLAEARRLRDELDAFYAEAAEAGLSARAVAARERAVLPRIEQLERAAGAVAPTSVVDLAGDPASWDGLPLDVQRTVLSAFMRPTLHRVGAGRRGEQWLAERLRPNWVGE